MVKNHLTRLAAPRTWNIERKKTRFIARPRPGAHSFIYGLPLVVVLRDMLKIAKTTREVKYILNNKEVNLNGKVVKDPRHNVGFMDVISIPKLKLFVRVILNEKKKLTLLETDEKDAKTRLAKVNSKTSVKGGKLIINLHDGENIIAKEKYQVGDSVALETGTNKISQKLELTKGAAVLLTGGKHVGAVGNVVEIIHRKLYPDQIVVKTKKEQFTTLRKYAFVVGEKEAIINIEK